MRRIPILLLALLAAAPAFAQSTLLQGGPWTPGHPPMYVGSGSGQAVVQDAGGAGGGPAGVGFSELGLTARGSGTPPYVAQGTGPFNTNSCNFDAPINNPSGYHFLCTSPNTTESGLTGGLITYGAGGLAGPLPLTICVNGTCVQPSGGAVGLTVGATTIGSGTSSRVLYDNAGVLGEYAITGSGSAVLSGSPTLTGVPLASTAANGTNTQQLATTAFVNSEITYQGITVGATTIGSGTNLGFLYDNAGLLGNLTQLGLDLRLSAQSPLTPATVCAGSNDTATFQAAINAAATNHGQTVNAPPLPCLSTATGVVVPSNAANVKLVGQGAGIGLDPAGTSSFSTSAASGPLLAAPNASGVDFGNMRFGYSNGSYAGNLLPFGSNANFTEFVYLHDFLAEGTGGAVGAASLTSLNNVLNMQIARCQYQYGVSAITSINTANGIDVGNCFFQEGFTGPQISINGYNANAWTIHDSAFEPALSGLIAKAIVGVGTIAGINVLNNNFPDATGGGKAFDFSGATNVFGFNFKGNIVQGNGSVYAGDLGPTNGAVLNGNYITSAASCAFYGGSASNVVAFGNSYGGSVTSTFCNTPTAGNNFYDAGGLAGFVINSQLTVTSYVMTANTSLDGLVLKNPTSSTSGNQQFSPRLRLTGGGWKTGGTPGDENVDFIMETQPVQGSSDPSGNLVISRQINGGGYTQIAAFGTNSVLTLGSAGSVIGSLAFGNATSGTETITPATGALGSGVATLAAGTYNLVGDSLTQTLTNKTISGGSNALSNIANASLTNSSLTIGSTNIALGATSTTLAGLTSVAATTFTGALTGHASSDLALTGGTMSGAIAMGGQNITGGGSIAGTAITGTSAKLNSTAIVADFADDKAGGDVFATRYNSGNPRFVIGIGGSSASVFFGSNLVWSGSGNVWNFDKTGNSWTFGNLAGAPLAAYLCGNTGTAGASAGTDANTGCGFGISTAGDVKVLNSTASTSTSTGAAVVTGGFGVGGATFLSTLNVTGLTNVATTSAVCVNTSTGLLSYDGTVGTCTVSDERLKNMGPRIDNALDKLLQINGVNYTWKDPAYGSGPQIGVGAQTVERVFPELVQTGSDGYKSVDYQRLTAPIIEALRELKADNDNLRACQQNWRCRIFGWKQG